MVKEATHGGAGAGPSTDERMIRLLTGMWAMQAASTAARLGIPDALAPGPKTPDEVAERVGAHPGAVKRLLRGLASVGILTVSGAGRYALSDVGERLRSDRPDSLRDMFIAEADTVHWRSWERLDDAVRTGEPRPSAVFGASAFDYYGQHPAEGEQFGRAMESMSRFVAGAVLEAYDFGGVKTLMDVGGGNGSLALAILGKHTRLSGIVFDLPYIESAARENLRASGAGDRCRFEPGSFFDRVPGGADLHVLKFILHDWNDDESVRLLKSCRAAMPAGGRLLVIEQLVPEEIQPGMVHLMDLNMLVMTGGLERTATEYGSLLARAGFRVTRVIPTPSPFSLIEGAPA